MAITKEQAWHLHAYVVDHAADHDDECPGDSTCDCSFEARNAAVNAVVKAVIELAHTPAAPVGEPAPMPTEMPQVEVGDWVRMNGGDPFVLRRKNMVDHYTHRCPYLDEIRGTRHGQPFIWQRANRKEPT